jgi:hypothetical protein
MSVGFYPKAQSTMNQVMNVQRLIFRGSDTAMYSTTIPNNTGVVCALILEPVNAIVSAVSKVDSTGVSTSYSVSAAACSIIDSQGGTSGFNESGTAVSDQGAIKLTGLASLAADDTVVVEYIVQAHL